MKNTNTEKRITFCIPGPFELQRRYIHGAQEMGLPIESITLQIGIPHSFIPGEFESQEYIEQITRSVDQALADCAYSDLVDRAFLNMEGIRDDGTWWLGDKMRNGYEEHDIDAIQIGTQQIKRILDNSEIEAEISAYRIPALPHNRNFNFTDFSKLISVVPALESLDWLWHNLYPTGGDIANRTITEENKDRHTARIIEGAEMLETLGRGKPVVGCLFPRYITDNLTYFNHYLPALLDTEITELLIWSNPHTEFMTNIYLRELAECADSIKKWLNAPLRSQGQLQGAG